MSTSTAVERTGEPSGWHRVTVALVAGVTLASAGFFHIAVVATPGLDPPPETTALFLLSAAVGVVGYSLLRQRHRAGYAVAVLTGLVVLASVGVILSGVYGPGGPRTNPVGPVGYLSLSVAVIVSAVLGWRGSERGRSVGTATASR